MKANDDSVIGASNAKFPRFENRDIQNRDSGEGKGLFQIRLKCVQETIYG